jgi:VIT1/CCC1 family predicted Fe2+/Mn2+ transporter
VPGPGHDLTGSPPGATAAAIVEAWLDRLAAALPRRPRRTRAAIVDELRDGLHEAIRAHQDRGAPPILAARAAVAEFGDPATVAVSFTDELAAARARALALRLIGTGPAVGALWLGALLGGPAAAASALPIPPWHLRPAGLPAAWLLVPAAVVTVLIATTLILTVTGRLSRWLPARPRLAPAAAATAALITAAVDLGMLTLLAVQALRAGPVAGPLLPLAAAASLTRMTLAARAARGVAGR